METFLKDRFLMEEDHRKDDLLDFSDEIDRLRNTIEGVDQSSIIGYIGKFGSGKSTAIFQLQKEIDIKPEVKWFDFDAWKYPERRDLWEGFVLDIADQLGGRPRAKSKIDASGKMQKTFGIIQSIAEAIGNYEPAIKIGGAFINLFKGAPIERVYELQELLKKILEPLSQQRIYIVVEDIDRSGDAGRFFLETLRQFIKNNLLDKTLVVIVPIGSEVYEGNEEHRASFQKVIDYPIFFEPRNIGYQNFIEAAFLEQTFPYQQTAPSYAPSVSRWREHLDEFFRLAQSKGLTVREIKGLVRSADAAYGLLKSKGYNPDPRIVLALELLNYIPSDSRRRWSQTLSQNKRLTEVCPVWKFLFAVAVNDITTNVGEHWKSEPISFVDNNDFAIPVPNNHAFREEERAYRLSSFYLIPLGLKEKTR